MYLLNVFVALCAKSKTIIATTKPTCVRSEKTVPFRLSMKDIMLVYLSLMEAAEQTTLTGQTG